MLIDNHTINLPHDATVDDTRPGTSCSSHCVPRLLEIYVMPDVYASAEIPRSQALLVVCASSTFNMTEFYNYRFWKSFKNRWLIRTLQLVPILRRFSPWLWESNKPCIKRHPCYSSVPPKPRSRFNIINKLAGFFCFYITVGHITSEHWVLYETFWE